ncbi:DsbA family protein [Allosphingosinicella vermicomposti]|uniref:DsbA family protein n=1 Tax=Allosphingosinicella vermicomposti TaxID=614671 RepID=UPI001FE11633|nr:DsbA family protein [Allosphingosinicella vermicomposti]
MILAAGLVGALIGASAMALAPGGAVSSDKAAIEKIVRDYILEHPEIIPEAMERLHGKQMAQAVNENRAALETPFKGAWAGAADGDVVLVEFFDYACGYCKASQADVLRLLNEDKKLKVVWREFPVLGDASQEAALVSLAAAETGKYAVFHNKLFDLGRPTDANVKAAQTATGLDPAKVAAAKNNGAYQSEIEKNYDLARTLNMTGTPAFVIGATVLQGAVGYEALKKAIAEARAK